MRAGRPARRPERTIASSTIKALTMPSPVVCRSSASRWPEPSPPSCQPRSQQLLEHVAVADRGAHDVDAARGAAPARRRGWSSACRPRRGTARPWSSAVGSDARRAARRRCRGGRRRRPSAAGRRRRRARCRSRRRAATHRVDERLRRGRAEAGVDVEAVRAAADRRSPRRRARGRRRARRGRPRRARVDDDRQAAQRQVVA